MVDPVFTALAAAGETLRRSRRAGRIRSDAAVQAGVEALGMPVDRAHRRRIAIRLDLARLQGTVRDAGMAGDLSVLAARRSVRGRSAGANGSQASVDKTARDVFPTRRRAVPPGPVPRQERPPGTAEASSASISRPAPLLVAMPAAPLAAATGKAAELREERRAHAAPQAAATSPSREPIRRDVPRVEVHRLTAIAAVAFPPSRAAPAALAGRATPHNEAARQVADLAPVARTAPAPTVGREATSLRDRAMHEQLPAAPVIPRWPEVTASSRPVAHAPVADGGLAGTSVRSAPPAAANPSSAPATGGHGAGAAAPVTWRGDRPMERTAAAPRQMREQAREAPMSGTIMIDGAELGRWIVDHLTQAASRPPAGGTAFDPRMTPVWAGASIGA